MTPEELARLWHDTYERLAPEFGYTSRKSSPEQWSDISETTRNLMIATAERILEKLKLEANITWSNSGLQ